MAAREQEPEHPRLDGRAEAFQAVAERELVDVVGHHGPQIVERRGRDGRRRRARRDGRELAADGGHRRVAGVVFASVSKTLDDVDAYPPFASILVTDVTSRRHVIAPSSSSSPSPSHHRTYPSASPTTTARVDLKTSRHVAHFPRTRHTTDDVDDDVDDVDPPPLATTRRTIDRGSSTERWYKTIPSPSSSSSTATHAQSTSRASICRSVGVAGGGNGRSKVTHKCDVVDVTIEIFIVCWGILNVTSSDVTFDKRKTIQRRLAWPLRKDGASSSVVDARRTRTLGRERSRPRRWVVTGRTHRD